MNVLVFFDIDGTLLRSGGAGFAAMDRTAKQLFGIDSLGKVPVHGRTDAAIVSELLEKNELPDSVDIKQNFYDEYIKHLPVTMRENDGHLLPGVSNLLADLAEISDAKMGILTGNIERAARIKLRHFGIDHFFNSAGFRFGGYGDIHPHRDLVAREALDDANRKFEFEKSTQKTVVVGDTIHDIRCAKAIGAKSIAVLTGGIERVELESESPDAILESCEDIDSTIYHIMSC